MELSERESSAIGVDVALLILRVILAAGMGAHGLIKVFGFFGGPGLERFDRCCRALVSPASASVVVSKWSGGFFEGQGFELELTFASIALALLLTGPGRLALDVKRPWRRRPVPYGVAGMALAGVISIITLVLFR